MSDFWARRKSAVKAEASAEEARRLAALDQAEDARLEQQTDEELLAANGLPAPEFLEDAEQVRDFLKAALPQRLKTRALRHLWRMNPLLANIDGLVDYGEDFTDSATVVENLQTVYEVGKGMISRLEDMADLGSAESQDRSESDPEESQAVEVVEARHSLTEEPEAQMHEPALRQPYEPTDETEYSHLPASSRRMRFTFSNSL